MGVGRAQKVTLEFLDKDGNIDPNQGPVTGAYCVFYAAPRPDRPDDPDPVLGSQDWLTDVLLADTQAKLTAMKPTQIGDAYTSASSRQVQVQYDVGNKSGRVRDRLTLATSSTGDTDDRGFLLVDRVRVMPGNTNMRPGHPLWEEWKKMKIKLEAMQKALPEKLKAKGAGRK